jgi:hypothetical protein
MGSNQKGLSRIPQSPVEYADLIELSIIAQPRSTFSIDKIRELFPEYLHVDDIVIGIAVEEMRRRSALLGSKYPFNVTNARILPDESSSIYVYLLATSFRSFIRGSSADQEESISKRFEELSEFCLCSFFGGGTQIINFGFPSSIGRPANFPEAIEWLAIRMGIQSGRAYRSPRRQDGGVDLVVWRNFEDGKPGVPIVLVQATIQQDLLPKSRDIDLRLWSGWLSMDADPLMGLTSPHVIVNVEVWNEVSRNCLLFDRIRLTKLGSILFEPEPIDRANLDHVLKEIEKLS